MKCVDRPVIDDIAGIDHYDEKMALAEALAAFAATLTPDQIADTIVVDGKERIKSLYEFQKDYIAKHSN